MSDRGAVNGSLLTSTSLVRAVARTERNERRTNRSSVPLVVSAALVAATSTLSPTSPSQVVLLGVAGVSMLATAIALTIDRGRDGFSVLIEATVATGLLMLVADAAGAELVAGGGVDSTLRVASVAAAVLAVAAFVSFASVVPDRVRPGVLVLASTLTALASVTANVAVSWRTPSAVTRGSLIGASLALAAVAFLDGRSASASPRLSRPMRASFGRLALVVASVLAGPIALAAVTAGWTSRDAVARAALPLAALAALGVAHLARLLDQRAHLEHLALHDELTGLPNRALFVDHLQQTIAASAHANIDTAVLFVDVDRFKKVNDSLGHPAGDELLRHVASRLRLHLRGGDTVARLGGDEFGVVLAACDDEEAACVAERMLAELTAPVTVLGHEVFVGASIGIAIGPRDGDDALVLLRNADAAMYSAKGQGRGRLARYRPELNNTAEERLDLESELHRALASNTGLLVHYQPKVDLTTGAIVGAEALIRWHHPTRGLLMPGQFIPMAEDTGLIIALGEWVLLRTCAEVHAWTERGLPPITVSVNLSARQFEPDTIADIVANALRTTGLDAAQLELELTESLALQDSDEVVNVLNDLRSLGVSCSIDDFGTGYSGLNYLTRFPIDRLKIDKSFVAKISAGARDADLVSAVIAMAHGLGLGVVAEGVETEDQAAFLRAHGCDHMQGYLFSRPIPPTEFEELLRDHDAPPAWELHTPTASVHVLAHRRR